MRKQKSHTNTVVVKKLCASEEDEEDHKEFIKQARMLYNIQHDNIVKFKAFCQKPYAIMLEYVYFDFSIFGDKCDKKVHSLREFLVFVDKEQVLEVPGTDSAGASFMHSTTESRDPRLPCTGSNSYETGNRHYMCKQ